MRYLVFVAYYAYALAVLVGSAYLVFWQGISSWWFVLTLLLLNNAPTVADTPASPPLADPGVDPRQEADKAAVRSTARLIATSIETRSPPAVTPTDCRLYQQFVGSLDQARWADVSPRQLALLARHQADLDRRPDAPAQY